MACLLNSREIMNMPAEFVTERTIMVPYLEGHPLHFFQNMSLNNGLYRPEYI